MTDNERPAGACEDGPVIHLLADGEEVEECCLCGAIVPTDLADGPSGFAAWCERKVK